jgi:threonine dehydrogenase-like Zn-dependent dehydrogenase
VAYDRSVIGSVGSTRRDFDDALATLPRIDTDPFLKAQYRLQDYEKALAAARSRTALKVMLAIDTGN